MSVVFFLSGLLQCGVSSALCRATQFFTRQRRNEMLVLLPTGSVTVGRFALSFVTGACVWGLLCPVSFWQRAAQGPNLCTFAVHVLLWLTILPAVFTMEPTPTECEGAH